VLYELGLIPALEWLAERMKSDYGLSVELSGDPAAKGLGQVPRGILFRAIRELLINVARHAAVTTARVAARAVDDALVVTVSDAGVGFDVDRIAVEKKPSFGLESVRERLAYVGGRMQIASTPGRGTEVALTVPLRAEPEPEAEAQLASPPSPRRRARDP
jgi:signal transduction histidine kinase